MVSFDFNEIIKQLGTLGSVWGLKLLAAFAILLFGRVVAKIVAKVTGKALERAKVDVTLRPFLSSLMYYLVLSFVIVAALGAVGIETASLIAMLGAAGLAVGLALQGTLSNLAAGVMLMIFRPFRIGDYVDIAGTSGTIEAVGVFVTNLTTPDNIAITVPNSQIWGQTIKNYAAKPTRRNDIVVGVSYSDDLGVAKQSILDTLKKDPRVLAEPEPQVAVSELGDSSVNFVVRPWCKREDYWDLRFDLLRAIKEDLETAGCSIPFPQSDVHLHQVDAA